MEENKKTFNFLPWIVGTLAIVSILLIYRNSADRTVPIKSAAVSETESTASEKSSQPAQKPQIVTKQEKGSSIGLTQEEVAKLPNEVKKFHSRIEGTTNFASGITIAPLLKALNQLINNEIDAQGIKLAIDEKDLSERIEALKVNPRKTGDHYSYVGRTFLAKLYELQTQAYPKLANQLREIKSALGNTPASGNLEGYGSLVKKFFEESLVFLYLVKEENRELKAPEEIGEEVARKELGEEG